MQKKRYVEFLLIVLVIMLCCYSIALSENAQTLSENGFTYIINDDGTATITNHEGNDRDLPIPETLGGHIVSAIGESAFSCDGFSTISFPESLTSIGDFAFMGCANIDRIMIINNIAAIGKGAFSDYQSLKIAVTPEHPIFASINDVLFRKDDRSLICYPLTKKEEYYAIPEGIIKIEPYAFYNCHTLTSIYLPKSLTYIGESAFAHCYSLFNSLSIPNGVKTIGESAFQGCQDLYTISLPNKLTSIGDYAFKDCTRLKNIAIPNNVTTIGKEAFMDCDGLETITIPNGITTIEERVFFSCEDLVTVSLPEHLTKIGREAFSWCSDLTDITLSSSLVSIDEGAFSYCMSLKSISIPDGITTISEQAFHNCTHLSNITLPEGLISIGDNAFTFSLYIESITIPDGVSSIGKNAFNGCERLSKIILPDSIISIGDEALDDCDNISLTVGRGSYAEEFAKRNSLPYQYPESVDWLN